MKKRICYIQKSIKTKFKLNLGKLIIQTLKPLQYKSKIRPIYFIIIQKVKYEQGFSDLYLLTSTQQKTQNILIELLIIQKEKDTINQRYQKILAMEKSQDVYRFYDQVFNQFIKRLFLAYRYKSTITNEQIDRLGEKVKDKMSDRRHLFQYGVNLTLNKNKKENQTQETIHNNGRVKLEAINEDQLEDKENSQQKEDESESQSNDDLAEFNQKNNEQAVKQEAPEEKSEEVKEENESQERQDEEDRKKQQILAKCQKGICAHIIATYSTKTKKHIPKAQKTKVDLENVFVRYQGGESFFTKISCDLEQAQYTEIRF